MVIDAVGAEIYTFDELVRLIANKTHSQDRVVHLRPGLALFLSRLIGYVVKDVVLTRDEVEGLMAGLLVSGEAPRGKTRLSEWLEQNAGIVGSRYLSDLKRYYR